MIVPHQPLRGGRSILEVVASTQSLPSPGLLPPGHHLLTAPQFGAPDLAARLTAAATTVTGVTDHALLVVRGQFAHKLGLTYALAPGSHPATRA